MSTRTRAAPPEIFDLPVEKMREGYYSDVYFNFTRETLLADGRHPRVVMQVFQTQEAVLGGMDEAIAILELCSEDWDALTVHALYDGDAISPWETVMTIEGDYTLFAHLETTYLGVLARRTLISTNVRRVVEAANGKPILFFPARHDHHRIQTGDGYAAHVGGRDRRLHRGAGVVVGRARLRNGSARADLRLRREHGARGDEVRRARATDKNIVVLVDFENDSVQTTIEVARALGPQLWGVRLDTSRQLVDHSLWDEMGDFDPRGVTSGSSEGARGARPDGFEHVKIVVSGGFTAERIPVRAPAIPWTPTASARRSSAARTTTPPTSS